VRCPECRIEPELHAEIVVALADFAPTVRERDDMARSALEQDFPPGRRPGQWIAPALAAAALLAVVSVWWALRPERPERPEHSLPAAPAVVGDIEDQRRLNDGVLAKVRSGGIQAQEGEWAVIAGGKFIGTAKELSTILGKAERLAPGAVHRYIFRFGHADDVAYRSLVDRQMVGLAFLRQVGLNFWEGRSAGEGLFRVEDGRLRMTIEMGWPGSGAPVKAVDVDVVTGFTGPIVLPNERMCPQFEMPGSAVVRAGSGMKTYARYVIAVRVGEKTHYVEALVGASSAPPAERATARTFEWVQIPKGTVRFGEPGRTVEVDLDAFEIMKYEVTNRQWWEYLRSEESRLRRLAKFNRAVPRHWNWNRKLDAGEFPSVPSGLNDRPVVHITWYQANDFSTVYLRRKLECAETYLPTGAQWEMAARGTEDVRRYPWGDEATVERDSYRELRCNVRETGIRMATDVALFPLDRSPFGVFGMAGNVSEFVGYPVRNQMAYRGGSFEDPVVDAQIHIKVVIPPRSTFTWSNVGFRAARAVSE